VLACEREKKKLSMPQLLSFLSPPISIVSKPHLLQSVSQSVSLVIHALDSSIDIDIATQLFTAI